MITIHIPPHCLESLVQAVDKLHENAVYDRTIRGNMGIIALDLDGLCVQPIIKPGSSMYPKPDEVTEALLAAQKAIERAYCDEDGNPFRWRRSYAEPALSRIRDVVGRMKTA